jgi:hypothetical protein
MTDATTVARQHDPSLCPSWCSREHLGFTPETDSGAFHHESDTDALLPAHQADPDGVQYLFVSVSQLVDTEGQAQPAQVELQDSARTVALMTSDEATQLAQALLAAAAKAQSR